MAMKDQVFLLYPEYQVYQNGQWQWVTANYAGMEAMQVGQPFYQQGGYHSIYHIPNSALTSSLRVVGLYSSPAENWLIKVSQGNGNGYSEILAVLDGDGHLTAGITMVADSFQWVYCSEAGTTPPTIQPVERYGTFRINTVENI